MGKMSRGHQPHPGPSQTSPQMLDATCTCSPVGRGGEPARAKLSREVSFEATPAGTTEAKGAGGEQFPTCSVQPTHCWARQPRQRTGAWVPRAVWGARAGWAQRPAASDHRTQGHPRVRTGLQSGQSPLRPTLTSGGYNLAGCCSDSGGMRMSSKNPRETEGRDGMGPGLAVDGSTSRGLDPQEESPLARAA